MDCGLISEDSRRTEPPADAPHYHVWADKGRVLIVKAPRFPSRQAARNAAIRAGMKPGTFRVMKCNKLPCPFARESETVAPYVARRAS